MHFSTLRKGKNYWQWYRFALEAQDVLVFGNIPGEAIYASIPLTAILPKLPSYFFKEVGTQPFSSLSSSINPKLFDHLAWEIGDAKRQRRLSRASTIGTSPGDKYTAPQQQLPTTNQTKHLRPPIARSVLLCLRALCNFPFRLDSKIAQLLQRD